MTDREVIGSAVLNQLGLITQLNHRKVSVAPGDLETELTFISMKVPASTTLPLLI